MKLTKREKTRRLKARKQRRELDKALDFICTDYSEYGALREFLKETECKSNELSDQIDFYFCRAYCKKLSFAWIDGGLVEDLFNAPNPILKLIGKRPLDLVGADVTKPLPVPVTKPKKRR